MNRSITFRTQLMMNGITLALVALLLLATSTFQTFATSGTPANSADSTTTINYQGHLTDNAGEPINGTLPMTFKLYRDPSGGTAVWTEQRSGSNAVPVTDGLFSVSLGSVTPLETTLFGEPLWLGISVNGDAEMTPREPFAGVPYAAVAGTVPSGSISSDKLNLQQGRQCLSSGLEVNSSTGGTVPGMSLNFSLEQPSTVLIAMEGVASLDPNPADTDRYEISLNLDGERETNHAFWTGGWHNLDAQRIVSLDAGTHTLKADAHPPSNGTITFYSSDYSYGGNQLCINYVVLGDQ